MKLGRLINNLFERDVLEDGNFIPVICCFEQDERCGSCCAAFGVGEDQKSNKKYFTCARMIPQTMIMAEIESHKVSLPDADVDDDGGVDVDVSVERNFDVD